MTVRFFPALALTSFLVAPTAVAEERFSFVVLDWNRDGRLATTSGDDMVPFDRNADGRPEAGIWVKSEDAILVYDANGDGRIENGRELFGAFTNSPKAAGPGERTYRNGFLALAQFDANYDGRLDRKDAGFGLLYIWQDHNQNGISEPNELTRLADTDVTALILRMKEPRPGRDAGGASIFLEAEYEVGGVARYVAACLDFPVGEAQALVAVPKLGMPLVSDADSAH